MSKWWCLVEILKLMQGRDSEDVWSRFVFELVIWPKEVTLVSRTQLSGPLCLWQCFRFRLWLDFKQHSMAVTKTTCIWEFWPEPRNRSPRSWLESRYTSGRRIKIRLIAEDKTIVRLEGFIVHAGGRCCWYLRNSVRPNYKVLLIEKRRVSFVSLLNFSTFDAFLLSSCMEIKDIISSLYSRMFFFQ